MYTKIVRASLSLSITTNINVKNSKWNHRFQNEARSLMKEGLWLIYIARNGLGYGLGLRFLSCTEIGSRLRVSVRCAHVLHSTMYQLGLKSEFESVAEFVSVNVNEPLSSLKISYSTNPWRQARRTRVCARCRPPRPPGVPWRTAPRRRHTRWTRCQRSTSWTKSVNKCKQ